MRIFLYKLLTLLIILTGRLRFRVVGGRYGPWEIRKDRDEQNLMPQAGGNNGRKSEITFGIPQSATGGYK